MRTADDFYASDEELRASGVGTAGSRRPLVVVAVSWLLAIAVTVRLWTSGSTGTLTPIDWVLGTLVLLWLAGLELFRKKGR